MARLSRTERAGLSVLALILAAAIAALASKRQQPAQTTSPEVANTEITTAVPPDSVKAKQASRPDKKRKETPHKPAKPPRRHLDDGF
ncbi:MAG: hypothetical protein K2O38_01055 [Muribaculaceae bacterium]|nr:hypothetical protein [Muribaculaceae bacterium]